MNIEECKRFTDKMFRNGFMKRKIEYDENKFPLFKTKINVIKTIHINGNNYVIYNIRYKKNQIFMIGCDYYPNLVYKYNIRECLNYIKTFEMVNQLLDSINLSNATLELDDYVEDTKKELRFDFNAYPRINYEYKPVFIKGFNA